MKTIYLMGVAERKRNGKLRYGRYTYQENYADKWEEERIIEMRFKPREK